MAYSISTHNGSTLSLDHNRRLPSYVKSQTHIKPNGDFEIWLHKGIKEAYHEIFDQAQAEYNAKQKRDDRKIPDYYKKVRDSERLKIAYEMIVTVGNKQERPDTDTCRRILGFRSCHS